MVYVIQVIIAKKVPRYLTLLTVLQEMFVKKEVSVSTVPRVLRNALQVLITLVSKLKLKWIV